MLGWVKDVNETFQAREFQDSEPILYKNISEGIQKWCKHLKGDYGLKHALPNMGQIRWEDTILTKPTMDANQNQCQFFEWMAKNGLAMCLTWADEKLFIAHKDRRKEEKRWIVKAIQTRWCMRTIGLCGMTNWHRALNIKRIDMIVMVKSLFNDFGNNEQGWTVLTPHFQDKY